ncbi:MAG: L-histidine N(alpha)-methyltransferase [Pyrinomonadaceae bacterium]|nr:L-histidine N(alpha)-methyltransferase [Pyrinomonadaceae bacterium]
MSSTEHLADGESRLNIHTLIEADARTGFAADVRRGLRSQPKRLFPKYFYDTLGSVLFDAICLLPEYYLTRAEDEIFATSADEIVAAAVAATTAAVATGGSEQDAPLTLLELGSGSAAKTRQLIEALLRRQDELLYVPIDISAPALETSARVLLQSYPALRIEGYASDYDTALAHLCHSAGGKVEGSGGGRTLALFLGSNVGNFELDEAEKFLRALRGCLGAGDALLLGVDLKKSRIVLEAAYDDALGVTAAFNLNLLARINREFGADFDLRQFHHVAFYNELAGRVEIYLESLREQVVRLPALDLEVSFAAGERVHTEHSHKYDLAELDALAARTGFTRTRTWTDQAGLFSSNLFSTAAPSGF